MADEDLTAPLVETAATARGGGAELRPGTALGRYVIVDKLGAGTGGTVYAAFDSHLGRKIALKVLRGVEADGEGTLSDALLREAQLVATLDHPNVVTVHDIGQHGPHAFIAMELVVGSDLAAWLRRNPPTGTDWRARLAPWLLAGRGLVDAHARGVIHGDFKPANVLLGNDGRVRVTDFGIARLREHETEDADTQHAAEPRLWGTPRYMAPELFDGRTPDERSDVYAFCASVYEALYGAPPADGPDLRAAKQSMPTPVDPKGVPARVLEVLRRGLRADPKRRTPSLAMVVDALEGTTRTRRAPWIAASTVVVLGSAGALLWLARDDDPRCSGADARLQGAWDEPRRTEARAAFDRSQLPYAETAWRSFSAKLDQYAASWIATYTEVCELADPLLDAKMACLARRRAGLVALVDGVALGGPSRIAKAADAAAQLEPAADCLVSGASGDHAIPPTELAEEVARVDDLVTSAQIAIDLGDAEEAARVAAGALERAEALGYPPLVARAKWASGRAKASLGDYAAGRALLEQSTLLAEEVGDDTTAAGAGLSLIYAIAIGFADAKAALAWVPHVEVALERGKAAPPRWATFYDYRAMVLEDLGRTEESVAALVRGLAVIRELESDTRDAEIAAREAKLAALRGDIHEAVTKQREAVRAYEDVVGPSHPTWLVSLDALAAYLERDGDLEGAVATFERALVGARSVLGVDHPLTLSLSVNLATVLTDVGRYEEALDHYADAKDGFERTVGTDHPMYIGVIVNMAAALGSSGRDAEARELAERSIGAIEDHYGPEHRVVAIVYSTLGASRRRTGDPQAAIEPLEKALAIFLAQNEPAVEAADLQFELAQALAESGGDRDRARRLALAAQKVWHEAGATESVALVARWLQEH